MNEVPSFSRFKQQDTTASVDIPPLSQDSRRGSWQELLRPQRVEKAVLIADVVLIVAASLIGSFSYHWITSGDLGNVTAFAGLGLVVAINFVAIMAARRTYRLKSLTQFTRQARDTLIIWSSLCGLLAVVGFSMKVSSEFSRGST